MTRSARGVGSRSRPWLAVRLAGAAAVAAAALAGCTAATPGTGTGAGTGHPAGASRSGSASSRPAPSAAVVSVATGGAGRVSPAAPVTVTARGGRLTSVRMVNPTGKRVSGALAADGTSWHSTEDLGYAKKYRITADAVNGAGVATVTHRAVTTVTPANQTMPYFRTVYGSPMQRGATYGVGMIATVRFDEPIPDRAAAERALTVTTSPHVAGSWTWTDNQTLHWRPRHFYAPGTTVRITAKVYGKNLGHGLYGQSDTSTSFRIGPSHVSVADDRTHQVHVYFSGKLVRTMPTSMGLHSGETVDGHYISFWTMRGTYTVIAHENPARMCSSSYGLPADAPGGYACEDIPWSTKISTDGIYLHELDSTVGDQGHVDVSHGCLNLDYTNARWFYEHSRVGDVVQVVHMAGAPRIALWQGGDWSVPWSRWVAGSALH